MIILSDSINKTQLDVEKAEERGIIHRDYAAHYFRWSFALRYVKYQQNVLDVGCANGMLAQVLYVNKYKPKIYVGIDIRGEPLADILRRGVNFPVKTHRLDVRTNRIPYIDNAFHVVTCFEMVEHFMPEYLDHVLSEIKRVLREDGVFLLSTPNFNGSAAANHIHEYTEEELYGYIGKHFQIENQFGTFASQSDILPVLSESEAELFFKLEKYYDSNVMSNIFAPLYPHQSRNILWVLRKPEKIDS
jgi:2-polyprenyl-3-methyl-5-hydroxy-6-metoxy-1,4-benzoquinol methylase